ncbi:MAG: bifunctional diaminohydroxyphosphoribosylaminopyrimidine deaminase/5-amino-6-(5-phosphoribosylamino)uracil reductase RibD [Candidatus Mycalebacterium zealandia]|nr:MAG: bifunctional diaminohydroxyphosphoribosylaminopyrimidine deaminase/5-amino-6-(5-phosphoribosylamino)uracil reductase RibD [Candidatus Mycalebacterium zealandia]
MKNTHEKFMSAAIALARKGEGSVSPNPLVGAVIVKKGAIIGRGWHKASGLPHAEIEALKDCERKGKSPHGATMYVNLEPCARDHAEKRTPPCCDSIIKSGIAEVFIGCEDPNPKVGKGAEVLGKNGIKVKKGILKDRCRELNEMFFKNVKTGLPFVILKLSASADGKIATRTGNSKWIGNISQRKMAHMLRKKCDAVLVGSETVRKDNPSLDVRLVKAPRQPVRIVADTGLSVSPEAKMFEEKGAIVATGTDAKKEKIKKLEKKGVEILRVKKNSRGKISMRDLMKKLSVNGIKSVLIEGGGKIAASALKEKIVDKMIFFYSPVIIGGDGTDMVSGMETALVKNAKKLIFKKTTMKDGTIVVEAKPEF